VSLPTPHETDFVRYLVSLTAPENRDGRAALAALRRGLGRRPGTAAETYPYVAPRAPQTEGWDSDRYYLVASLFASHPLNWPGGESDTETNFGASLRRAKRDSGGAQAQLIALLNSDRNELPDRMRHSVSLCAAAQPGPVPVDWAQLLSDLRWWSSDRRDVQRRWASSFWRPVETKEEE